MSPRNLPYLNSFWNTITYEMSLSRYQYTRTVYSYLDLLRDIGGLFSAIAPMLSLLDSIVSYRGAHIDLTAEMMPPETKDEQRFKFVWNCFKVILTNM